MSDSSRKPSLLEFAHDKSVSNNGRHSALTITAHEPNTAVTVADTDEDGDTDDSTSAVLQHGQSIVVMIRDGAVNDGAGGKWDGDRLIVDSDKPVTAMLSTRSDWQHDWVPAEGHTMRGSDFFMWAPRPNWEIDVVAYEPGTHVELYEISTAPTSASGVTQVALPGSLLLRQTLDEGEDLLVSRGKAGADITRPGHTYRVLADRPVTVMFGSFVGNERDGGGYVPSEDGTTVGRHFYFPLISGPWQRHERELRIVAGDAPATVTVRGRDAFGDWHEVDTTPIGAFGHLDYTGVSHAALKDYDLFEVEATGDITVFAANWLETDSIGTSDVISYVSALDGESASDVGQEFMAYIGPPGIEGNAAGVNGTFSHLYLAAFRPGTQVTITDADTGGALFSRAVTLAAADDIADVRITPGEYGAMNVQVFRMFVLDCSATVTVEQIGTSGTLRDNRYVRLADDSVVGLGAINPALILAHSGIGTFETGGTMNRLLFATPEDWVTEFGPMTAPEFTHYAFLDDETYLGSYGPATEVFPLGADGVAVPAGIWFVNHYLWTYANAGTTRIETRFTPGPDCGGSL